MQNTIHGVVQYDILNIRGPLANAVLILINALFLKVGEIGKLEDFPEDYGPQLLDTDDPIFDFIIVGSGSAGSVVANRLSEYKEFSVLILEAGDYPTPSTQVPLFYSAFRVSTEKWKFVLEKGKVCQATKKKLCHIGRAKVLGGSSTVNKLHYSRGLPDDFDSINKKRWSSNITHTIFTLMENFQGNNSLQQFNYGKNGSLYLSTLNDTSNIKYLLHDVYKEQGYHPIPKRKFVGYTEHIAIASGGERNSYVKAYLNPIKDRPNLFVALKAEVKGIITGEPADKRAKGVNVTIDDICFPLYARKEVILAAGAINNAKLLLKSGIGPKQYLSQKNIPLVADLPGVGKNLQVHLNVPVFVAIQKCHAKNATNSTEPAEEPTEKCYEDVYSEEDYLQDIYKFIMFRTGNFTNTNVNNFVHYITTKKIGLSVPDLAIYHKYFKVNSRNLESYLNGLDLHFDILSALLKYNTQHAIIEFQVMLPKPKSTGEVFLNDTHFDSNPKVQANFLNDPADEDYTNLLTGVNYITNLIESTQGMRALNATFLDVKIPNCRNLKFCTLQYIKCYIMNMAYPFSNFASTTKMGEDCEENAVVQYDLQVKRVRCLRVGDSSALPSIPFASTMATDGMIGYMLGEILKEKWLKNYVSPLKLNSTYK